MPGHGDWEAPLAVHIVAGLGAAQIVNHAFDTGFGTALLYSAGAVVGVYVGFRGLRAVAPKAADRLWEWYLAALMLVLFWPFLLIGYAIWGLWRCWSAIRRRREPKAQHATTQIETAAETRSGGACLRVIRGSVMGVEFPIHDGVTRIGTEAGSATDINLAPQESWTTSPPNLTNWNGQWGSPDDPMRCYPRHAVIRCDTQGCRLVDLGSYSGTFVNRRKLQPNEPVLLQSGDKIQVGSVQLEFLDRCGSPEEGPDMRRSQGHVDQHDSG